MVESTKLIAILYPTVLFKGPEIPYAIAVKSRNSAGCGEEFQIYCFTQEGGII